MKDWLAKIVLACDGWKGHFVAVPDRSCGGVYDIVYLDEDRENPPYEIAPHLDAHVAESLVEILNAAPRLIGAAEALDEVTKANAIYQSRIIKAQEIAKKAIDEIEGLWRSDNNEEPPPVVAELRKALASL